MPVASVDSQAPSLLEDSARDFQKDFARQRAQIRSYLWTQGPDFWSLQIDLINLRFSGLERGFCFFRLSVPQKFTLKRPSLVSVAKYAGST